MYKKTLYIPVGISGQGKTSYANKIKSKDDSIKIVSIDTVWNELTKDASMDEVFKAMRKKAKEYLQHNYSVFFDAPNLKSKYRKEVIDDIGSYAEFIVGVYFPADVDSAKKNNEKRKVHVSDEEFEDMIQSMDGIDFGEGFNSIWTVF